MPPPTAVPYEAILYSNSGVQLIYLPLRQKVRLDPSRKGWQRCRCRPDPEGPLRSLPFVQWQVAGLESDKFFLVVDTSLGDAECGYMRSAKGFVHDEIVTLDGWVDAQDQPLAGLPAVNLKLRPAADVGAAKDVHLIVDFGNSRTGALLLEVTGAFDPRLEMKPFALLNRHRLDAWREGKFQPAFSARWFSSKTCWCNTPYLEPETMTVRVPDYSAPNRPDIIRDVTPDLFDDLSLLRMGQEAEDVAQMMREGGNIRVGVSSPKRYLWADDRRWLSGATWYMADPYDRKGRPEHAARLTGAWLRYLDEDDSDNVVERLEQCLRETPERVEQLLDELQPHAAAIPGAAHPPRVLMVAALYELLCQAYTYANSLDYRKLTGVDRDRPRRIASLTLSYPSGMIHPERVRLRRQALKAALVFRRTLGKHQPLPKVTLSIDEASAVHLAYIWSEFKSLGDNAELWFSTLSRDRADATDAVRWDVARRDRHTGVPDPPASAGATPAPTAPASPASAAPAAGADGTSPETPAPEAGPDPWPSLGGLIAPAPAQPVVPADAADEFRPLEVRIACIDIGGGTTDLMIGRYWCEPGIADVIHGEMLHRDGVSKAGDRLVECLLERLIVPRLAQATGLGPEIQFFVGQETGEAAEFRVQRITWMNRLLVPLAHQYLDRAVRQDTTTPISHKDEAIVAPEVLESFEAAVTARYGPGRFDMQAPLTLKYNPDELEPIIKYVFDGLLKEYCERIVAFQADVVLLAGQPSKLQQLQHLVRMYLPLHESRLIPMHGYYAGAWYPYQDPDALLPGVIADPKSAVVVGTALKFLAEFHQLNLFQFNVKPALIAYHWGILDLDTARIFERRVLFRPGGPDRNIFPLREAHCFIGRRLRAEEEGEAAPVYVLEVELAQGNETVDLQVELIRYVHESNDPTDLCNEHLLKLGRVTGKVGGEPVDPEKVRLRPCSLPNERFFLDTGELHLRVAPRPEPRRAGGGA